MKPLYEYPGTRGAAAGTSKQMTWRGGALIPAKEEEGAAQEAGEVNKFKNEKSIPSDSHNWKMSPPQIEEKNVDMLSLRQCCTHKDNCSKRRRRTQSQTKTAMLAVKKKKKKRRS